MASLVTIHTNARLTILIKRCTLFIFIVIFSMKFAQKGFAFCLYLHLLASQSGFQVMLLSELLKNIFWGVNEFLIGLFMVVRWSACSTQSTSQYRQFKVFDPHNLCENWNFWNLKKILVVNTKFTKNSFVKMFNSVRGQRCTLFLKQSTRLCVFFNNWTSKNTNSYKITCCHLNTFQVFSCTLPFLFRVLRIEDWVQPVPFPFLFRLLRTVHFDVVCVKCRLSSLWWQLMVLLVICHISYLFQLILCWPS